MIKLRVLNFFRWFWVMVLCSFCLTGLNGQIDSANVKQSPYGVIYNHLYYLQDDSYQPELSARSFSTDISKRNELAIQLKQILDGRGIYVDINRLPKQNIYMDTMSNEAIYFLDRDEPRIYVEKINGRWMYSRTTAEQIPVMYEEIFPFGAELAEWTHGPVWDFKFFGITVLKWIGLLLLILLSVLVYYFVQFVSKNLVRGFIQRRLGILQGVQNEVSKLARVFSLFLITRLVLYFLPMFQFPVRFQSALIKGIGVLSIFFVIIAISRIASIIIYYLESLAQKTENTLDDQLMPVLNRIIKIIIWVLGVIYILDHLDVNVTALLAGISIGGLAIALAAQDTVKNFFGSLMIFLDRPFQIGDWINFDGVDGTVEEVGVRSTRIRTFANSVVYVPNGMLADKVVNNWGLRQYRRFKTDIGVTYNTPPDVIDAFVGGIREIIKMHPTTRKDYYEVHLNNFASSSINILLYCFFEAPDWSSELRGRHQVMHAIMVLAKELGVQFAFPSQSLYVETFPGVDHKGSKFKQDSQEAIQKIQDYFQKEADAGHEERYKTSGGE